MADTTTSISRLQLDHPDLGYTGGSTLHGVMATLLTKVGDNINTRYFEQSSIANSTTVTLTHNLNCALSDLRVLLYTGTGASKAAILNPTTWTVAATSGFTTTKIDVTTPSSGGPHSFSVAIIQTHGGVIRTAALTANAVLTGNNGTDSVQSSTLRVDTSGNVLANGLSTARANVSGSDTPKIQLEGTTSAADSSVSIIGNTTDIGGRLALGGTTSGTKGSTAAVTTDKNLGSVSFQGGGSTQMTEGARLESRTASTGTFSNTSMPAILRFMTTANGAASPTERMRISETGLVSIGTSTTNFGLTIKGTSVANSARMVIDSPDTSNDPVIQLASVGTTKWYIFDAQSGSDTYTMTNAATSTVFQLTQAGVLTLANLAGTGSRTVTAGSTGTLSAASDARLKEEVLDEVIPGLSEILALRPVAYQWKDDIAIRGTQAAVELGFFAQEVVDHIPSAAPMGNDGYYGMNDRALIATLVKAVQELKSEFEAYKLTHP